MSEMLTDYAKSIGVTEADAHTARNIHLSVADCKHIQHILRFTRPSNDHEAFWTSQLVDYLKGAC